MTPRGHSVIAVICVISSHNPSDFPGCVSVMILADSGNNMVSSYVKAVKHIEGIDELCVAFASYVSIQSCTMCKLGIVQKTFANKAPFLSSKMKKANLTVSDELVPNSI